MDENTGLGRVVRVVGGNTICDVRCGHPSSHLVTIVCSHHLSPDAATKRTSRGYCACSTRLLLFVSHLASCYGFISAGCALIDLLSA